MNIKIDDKIIKQMQQYKYLDVNIERRRRSENKPSNTEYNMNATSFV